MDLAAPQSPGDDSDYAWVFRPAIVGASVGCVFSLFVATLIMPFAIDGRLISVTHSELRFIIFTAVMAAVAMLFGLYFGKILSLVALIVASTLNTVNYVTFQYMNAPFFDVSYYLPRPSITDSSALSYLSYISQYVSVPVWLWSLAAGMAAVVLARRASTFGRGVLPGAVVATLAIGTGIATHFVAPARAIPNDLKPYAQIVPLQTLSELGGRERSSPPPPIDIPSTNTIVLVINESTGSDALDSSGSALLSSRLVELSGGPSSGLVPFRNAVANATATDVSIPSILSGAYPTDGLAAINESPLLFDYAKAAGFTTAFFSSSIVGWANFDKFLEGSAVDVLYSGESTGSPIVNDFAVDDALMIDAYVRYIRRSDPSEKLFIVLYPNALHNPFQRDSSIGIPAGITDRRSRATYLVERAHETLFAALKATGRFDSAAIFITGDHGLNMRPGAMSRLNQIDSVNLAPIFLVKPPDALSEQWTGRLTEKVERLVANVDIAASILDLLGYRSGQIHLSGYSLFGDAPVGRVSFALNNTEWRQWPQTTFSIARGHHRFHCSDAQFCVLEDLEAGTRSPYKASHTEKSWWRYLALAEDNPPLALRLSEIVRRFFAGGWYFTQMEAVELPLAELRLGNRSSLREDGDIDWTTGPEGVPVFYGPYMALPRGHYAVEWQGRAGHSGSDTHPACTMDVFDGETILASTSDPFDAHGDSLSRSIEFTAPKDEERLEFRLWCGPGTTGTVLKLALMSLN